MKTTLHNRENLKATRRALRSSLTPAEATLWTALKNGQLAGRKFRRQHSIGCYILDFYCPSERLAVELDGLGHYTSSGEVHDVARTQYLQKMDIQVVRFENKLVFEQLDFVLAAIQASFRSAATL